MKLEARELSFRYQQNKVFSDVSLDVNSGEVVCLLGPNGTGKTTLLKAILGLLKPYQGEVLLNGRNISHLTRREKARFLGYVPQCHTPPFPFSVLDVVLMGRTAHINNFAVPSKYDIHIARQAMQMLDIEHLEPRIFTELSGGERQMVLIARALAQEPEILVLDEPTSNLDFGNQARVLKYIRKLASLGLGVIMASHFPDHAFYYASKVVMLKDRRVYMVGSPDEVITDANLSFVYDVNVEVIHTTDKDGEEIRICVPVVA